MVSDHEVLCFVLDRNLISFANYVFIAIKATKFNDGSEISTIRSSLYQKEGVPSSYICIVEQRKLLRGIKVAHVFLRQH